MSLDATNLNLVGSNVFFLKVTADGGSSGYFGPYNLVIGCNSLSTIINTPAANQFNVYKNGQVLHKLVSQQSYEIIVNSDETY